MTKQTIGRTSLIPNFFLRDYTITASLKILSENPVKKSWWKKKLQCKTRKATYLDANKI